MLIGSAARRAYNTSPQTMIRPSPLGGDCAGMGPRKPVVQWTRQDFNVGFNKRFNFDGSFQPVAISGDTSASTVWSFGLSQQRLREPLLSSDAVYVISSLSYTISENWSVSLVAELLGRWYQGQGDSASAFNRDWEVLPIGTIEYAIRPGYSAARGSRRFWAGRPWISRLRI